MASLTTKLRVAGAFAALVGLALAVSCRGFFVNPTVQSITLQPPTPSLAVGAQQQMQAWATDSDNNKYLLTKNVDWSLSGVTATNGGSVMTLSSSGLLVATSIGSGTVNAASQGVSASTTATVVELTDSMTITPSTNSVVANGTAIATYVIRDQSGNDISSVVTLTAYTALTNGTTVSGITCTYNASDNPPGQDCTADSSVITSGSETVFIVVTYSGYTGTTTVSAQLTVSAS